MNVDPGFTWDDVVTGLNQFLALGPVSSMLVAVVVLGLVTWIASALKDMLGGS